MSCPPFAGLLRFAPRCHPPLTNLPAAIPRIRRWSFPSRADIVERDKPSPAAVGATLLVGRTPFEDFDEIAARWVAPIVERARALIAHERYLAVTPDKMGLAPRRRACPRVSMGNGISPSLHMEAEALLHKWPTSHVACTPMRACHNKPAGGHHFVALGA